MDILHKLGYSYDPKLKKISIDRHRKEIPNLDELKLNGLKREELEIVSLVLCGLFEDKTILLNRLKGKLSYLKDIKPQKREIEKIKGPAYEGNSCYLDSVLMLLFFNENEFIENEFFKEKVLTQRYIICKNEKDKDNTLEQQKNSIHSIRVQLNNMKQDIREGKHTHCRVLRRYIDKCRGPQLFHKQVQQDASEFLKYLFAIFNVNEAMEMRRVIHLASDTVSEDSVNTYWTHPIIDITSSELDSLNSKRTYHLCSFIDRKTVTKFDDKNLVRNKYNMKTETQSVIDSPIIIFNLYRMSGNRKFIDKKMYPSQLLFLSNFKTLSLRAIVVHNGAGHYTCFIKSKMWYYYDDTDNNGVCKPMSYENMLRHDPSPITHGTLFLYS